MAPGTAQPVASAPGNDSEVYNNLTPYGNWVESPDYGWYWQPYSWLAYDYYPSFWLGFGYWWNYPGRGWCWSPHSHFRGFSRFQAGRASFAGTRSGVSRVGGFQAHSRVASVPASSRAGAGINRGGAIARTSPWASSFNGGFHNQAPAVAHSGFSGSVRSAGSAGFHGAGATFHAGAGGGSHGGFSGGGRHR